MAVACQPRLLIADEPTTALDVTIQAQILELLKELVRESGTALIMITHDLGVVAGLCDTVNVLYAGRVVETAPPPAAVRQPAAPVHAWAARLDPAAGRAARRAAQPIPGSVRDNLPWAEGCAFAPRCARRIDACVGEPPPGAARRTRTGAARLLPLRQPGADAPRSAARCRRPPTMPTARPREDVSGRRADPLVEVRDLKVHFPIKRGRDLRPDGRPRQRGRRGRPAHRRAGETYGLVGESGCGKSTLGPGAAAADPPTGGEVSFDGVELTPLPARGAARDAPPHADDLPGPDVQPGPAAERRVDPHRGAEGARHRHGPRRPAAAHRARRWTRSGLPRWALSRYPHEFSGGQRQRIGIARALVLEPGPDRRRRAGVRAGRVDPGPGDQPAGRAAGRARPDLPGDRARPGRGPAHLRPGRRDVPGRAGRGGAERPASTPSRCTRTPGR